MSFQKNFNKVMYQIEKFLTYPQWRVDISTYSGGHFKDFYKKEEALEYAKNRGKGCFVDLINKKTKESIRISGPSKNKKKDPNCKHNWRTIGSASWYCTKCNAEFNLACEHGGSVACFACVSSLMKENEPFEDFLAKNSW
ncbi:unnamed protein product [marine sediment metagenome]|uniref:Uncharacterized protein n=1 Tax=marine sediment metagenome TaxID=412755 RepID=X1IC47_9ZZZZ